MIQFESDPQKACYEKVAQWMQELFGEMAMKRDDAPVFGVVLGSALAQISVHSWGDDDATVLVHAYVVTGAEAKPELMRFLLDRNAYTRFGSLGLDKDGDIVLQHSLIGSTCSKDSLRLAILLLLRTADELDDQIVSRWGGRRALDRRQ
jgi:hypothetical protein